MTSPFCTIVPPHLLEHLAASGNPAVAAAARRTLIADASARTARVLPRAAADPAGAGQDPRPRAARSTTPSGAPTCPG